MLTEYLGVQHHDKWIKHPFPGVNNVFFLTAAESPMLWP